MDSLNFSVTCILMDDTTKRGAPEGNQNASKDPEELLSSVLRIKCHPAEKAAYTKAAGGEKLSRWIRAALNEAAGLPPP